MDILYLVFICMYVIPVLEEYGNTYNRNIYIHYEITDITQIVSNSFWI
jgi:hypothetical protein